MRDRQTSVLDDLVPVSHHVQIQSPRSFVDGSHSTQGGLYILENVQELDRLMMCFDLTGISRA
jgi:hypothetical protein